MGFRFRKSITIIPGVRVNLSGSGASLSLGPRGASVSFGPRGTWANLGLPGSGLSYRTRLDRAGHASRQRTAAREHTRALRAELESEVDALNDAVDDLVNIHLLTPDPHTGHSLSELEHHYRQLALQPYIVPAPVRPEKPLPQPEPARPADTDGRGLFGRLFESGEARLTRQRDNETRWQQEAETCRRENALLLKRYQLNRQQWAEQYAHWQADAAAHEQALQFSAATLSQRFAVDDGYFESLLAGVLQSVEWPRETLISWQVQAEQSLILLDVDLPEVEDMPQYSVRVNARGTEVLEKALSQKAVRERYARHIHGVLLRLAGMAFCALPFETLRISGFTQRISPHTGHLEDDYIVSAIVERRRFNQLNFNALASVDPVLAFERFTLQRRMSATGLFQTIVPFS